MMEKEIAQLLPISVAVAFSPMPIAALMLMLLSNRAKINGVMFTIGWIFGLFLLVVVVSSLLNVQTATVTSSGPTLKKIIDGILGLILVLVAIKQWQGRPKRGETARTPKWMSAIESFSPIKAFVIGLGLATINLKNTPMGIAAGTILSQASSVDTQTFGMICYLVLGGSTILIPVVGFLLFGEKLQHQLESLKTWLIQNNATIMFVLFLILGANLISKAFGG